MTQIQIEKMVYGGLGFGKVDGKAHFVPFAAPGDIVDVKILKEHKGYNEAEIKKLIEESDIRVEPKCKHYGKCGGCHMQHMNYAAQLLWKQIMLEEQLTRLCNIAHPNVLPTVPSPFAWVYRNRVQVHRNGKKVGFCERESKKIVDVAFCPIADTEINDKLKHVRETWPIPEDRLELVSFETGGFSQINVHVNRELKQLVAEWIFEGEHLFILELYAGSGNLTFDLADKAEKIIAVESDERAVIHGRRHINRNRKDNVQFVNKRVEAFVKDKEMRKKDLFDVVLVDPPREGMGRDVVDYLCHSKPKRIIYVSCDPATLARDINGLLKAGYKLERSQPIDMFPQTYHIESVSLLSLG